ncbi:MAG TPA: hypothetical protein VIT22_04135 [Pseudoxanthomonas sp.]
MLFIALQGVSGLARASCAPAVPTDGQTVDCTGTASQFAPNSFSSNANNLTVTVAGGTTMGTNTAGGAVLDLSGNGITLNNSGSIDPSNGDILTIGTSSTSSGGARIGNLLTGSTVSITNNAGASMMGTPGATGTTAALWVRNGAGGTTTITNSGTMGTAALAFPPMLGNLATSAAVVTDGASNVNFTNNAGATIFGTVTFNGTGDDTFLNSGTVTGAISLGAGDDSFIADTGSSAGSVDAGIGINTLTLQGSGSGSVSSANYLGFTNLNINGGTWTFGGATPLVSGSASLNGGVAIFDSAAVFGAGTINAMAARFPRRCLGSGRPSRRVSISALTDWLCRAATASTSAAAFPEGVRSTSISAAVRRLA